VNSVHRESLATQPDQFRPTVASPAVLDVLTRRVDLALAFCTQFLHVRDVDLAHSILQKALHQIVHHALLASSLTTGDTVHVSSVLLAGTTIRRGQVTGVGVAHSSHLSHANPVQQVHGVLRMV